MIEVESLENPLFSNFSLKPYFVQPSVLRAGRQVTQTAAQGGSRTVPSQNNHGPSQAIFPGGCNHVCSVSGRWAVPPHNQFSRRILLSLSLSPPTVRGRVGADEIRARSCLQRLAPAFQEPGRDHTEGQGELVKSCGSFI